jgi:hypothetical protein
MKRHGGVSLHSNLRVQEDGRNPQKVGAWKIDYLSVKRSLSSQVTVICGIASLLHCAPKTYKNPYKLCMRLISFLKACNAQGVLSYFVDLLRRKLLTIDHSQKKRKKFRSHKSLFTKFPASVSQARPSMTLVDSGTACDSAKLPHDKRNVPRPDGGVACLQPGWQRCGK